MRRLVFDPMTPDEMRLLGEIAGKLIRSLDEDGKVARARGLVLDCGATDPPQPESE